MHCFWPITLDVTLDNIRIHRTRFGIYTYSGQVISLNSLITSGFYTDIYTDNDAAASVSLIDPGAEPATIYNANADGWCRVIYTVNINVTDQDGSALSGIAIKIEDQSSQTVSYVDSGTDLNEDLDKTETGVNVDDGTKFSAGDIILIDSEFMYIGSISTNTLTVTRQYYTSPTDGYKAEKHDDNSDIFIVGSPETDGSGDILEQKISYKQWYGTSENLSTYSPHKFTISKAGYETLILEAVTVDAPINWHLELRGKARYKLGSDTFFKDDS